MDLIVLNLKFSQRKVDYYLNSNYLSKWITICTTSLKGSQKSLIKSLNNLKKHGLIDKKLHNEIISEIIKEMIKKVKNMTD